MKGLLRKYATSKTGLSTAFSRLNFFDVTGREESDLALRISSFNPSAFDPLKRQKNPLDSSQEQNRWMPSNLNSTYFLEDCQYFASLYGQLTTP